MQTCPFLYRERRKCTREPTKSYQMPSQIAKVTALVAVAIFSLVCVADPSWPGASSWSEVRVSAKVAGTTSAYSNHNFNNGLSQVDRVDMDRMTSAKPGHFLLPHQYGARLIAPRMVLASDKHAAGQKLQALPDDGGAALASNAAVMADFPQYGAALGATFSRWWSSGGGKIADGAALVGVGGFAASRFFTYWKFETEKASLFGRAVPKGSAINVLVLGTDGKALYYVPSVGTVTMLSPDAKIGALGEVAMQAGVALQNREGKLTDAPVVAKEVGGFDAVITTVEVAKSNEPANVVNAALQALKPGGVFVFAEAGNTCLEALKANEDLLQGIQFDSTWADSAIAPHSLGVATTLKAVQASSEGQEKMGKALKKKGKTKGFKRR